MGFSKEENNEERKKLGYLHMGFVNKNNLNDPLTKVDYYDYVDDDIGEIKKTLLDADLDVLFTNRNPNIRYGFIYRKNGQNIAKVILEADESGGKTKNGMLYNKAKLTIYDIQDPKQELVFARIDGISGSDLYSHGINYGPMLDKLYTDWVINNINLIKHKKDKLANEITLVNKGETLLHRCYKDNFYEILTFDRKERKIKRYYQMDSSLSLAGKEEPQYVLLNTLDIPFSAYSQLNNAFIYMHYHNTKRDEKWVIDITYDEVQDALHWTLGSKTKTPVQPDWGLLQQYMQKHADVKIPLKFLKNLKPANTKKGTNVFRISNNFVIFMLDKPTILDGKNCEYELKRIGEDYRTQHGYLDNEGENVVFQNCDVQVLQQDGITGHIHDDEFDIFNKIMYISDGWKKDKEEQEWDNFNKKIVFKAEYDTGIQIKDRKTNEVYRVFYVENGYTSYFCFRNQKGEDINIKHKNGNNVKKIGDNTGEDIFKRLQKKIGSDDNYFYFYNCSPFSANNGTDKCRVGLSVSYEDQNPYDDVGFFNDRLVEFFSAEFPDFEVSKKLQKPKEEPDLNKLENDDKKPKNNDKEPKNNDENGVIEKSPEQKPPAPQEDEINKVILESYNLERKRKATTKKRVAQSQTRLF